MRPVALDPVATGFAASERAPGARRDGGSGFAGLLDGERQRLDARGGGVYDGSAFDVPSRPSEAAQAERRQIESRRAEAAPSRTAGHESKAPEADAAAAPKAKPGAEPTAQRAGLPAAKRPADSDASRTERTERADAADSRTEPHEAEATEPATAAADAARPDAAAAPGPKPTADVDLRGFATALLPQGGLPGASGSGATAALAGVTGGGLPGDARATATVGTDPKGAAASMPGAAGSLPTTEELHTATEPAAATAPIGRIDAPPQGLGLAAMAAPAPAAAAAPAVVVPMQASVPTPMESPAFGQALGWQLATFAQDGVQQAQLQLNPAEMGPVEVKIVLDGRLAQIDFAATQAHTRAALESSWPALAAAMHGAGFTLGGGGVFEQRSSQRDAEAQDGGSRYGHAARDGVGGVGDVMPVRASGVGPRGLLDLYA